MRRADSPQTQLLGTSILEQKQLSSSFVPPTGPQSLPRIFFSAGTARGGKTLSVPPHSGGSSSHRASRNIAARAAVTCAEGQPLPLSVVSHTHPHGFHPGKHSLLPLWLPRRGGSDLFAEKAQPCVSHLCSPLKCEGEPGMCQGLAAPPAAAASRSPRAWCQQEGRAWNLFITAHLPGTERTPRSPRGLAPARLPLS